MRRFLLPILAIFGTAPAVADPAGPFSEIKLGILAHDIRFVAADQVEGGADFNAELLFASPAILEPIFAPRPHIGVQVNTAGDTSQAYAGLTWTFYPADRFWLGASVGGTVHNGETDNTRRNRKAFGSQVLFRLAAEAGMDITDHLSASVYFDHESNAFLADRNPGIDNLGMRVGWRF